MNQQPLRLSLPDRELAYQQHNAASAHKGAPSIFFLGGFASDMMGSKALYLDQKAQEEGYAYLRFDYRGHGLSSGTFAEGCIGDWFDDALKIFDQVTEGPQILVGSSMGGWIGLLLARARPERVAGFVGLAAAPDFTEDMILPTMTAAQIEAMNRDGFFYEEPLEGVGGESLVVEHRIPITKKLMDDGINNLVLRDPLTINAPVRLIQGQNDADVPWQTALKIAAHVEQSDTQVVLIKDATHRLSREQDLALIWREVRGLLP